MALPARLPLLALAVLALLLAVACGGGGSGEGEPTEAPESPDDTAERFLSLWTEDKFQEMYSLVSMSARGTIDEQGFIDRYTAIKEEARIIDLEYELQGGAPDPAGQTPSPDVSGEAREVPFTVTFHTTFFGDIEQENVVPLVKEAVEVKSTPGEPPETRELWRVDWRPSVYFAELDDRSLVHFFTDVPRRGTIFDRNGNALGVDASLSVVGIVPDMVTDKEVVISRLAAAAGVPESQVRAATDTTLPSYYFIPVKTLPYGTPPEEIIRFQEMVDIGVVVREEVQRVYPYGAAAAHTLGYITEVTEEQLVELAPKGFQPGDKIGAIGIEGDQNDVLAGERGALLATLTPEGSIGREIAEKPAVPGKDIYLTLDINVQVAAEKQLGERVGSVVAMDPRDNSVLALASFPRFDPNEFVQGLSGEKYNILVNDPRNTFLHRPLLATYPPGSTFKTVTAAAGLERGGFSAGSTFHCVPRWTRLGEEFAQNNWQKTDRGWLTVAEGLMASCNPVFFDIAATVDPIDENILPGFARAFGYGAPTGINALDEAPGTVPDAAWKEENIGDFWYTGDAVNMAIGQGYVTVTPLQIANAYSTIAGGGVLRKPLLIKKIAEAGGAAAQEFQAEVIHPLPVSAGNLDIIRQGLTMVTHSAGGTSYQVFAGSSVDAAGKSGTAEDIGFGSDHVFFVAYANRSDPSIVALAALETGESGSREAGPMVRRILESYITGAAVSAEP
jgi:penicillin-binding protein 2